MESTTAPAPTGIPGRQAAGGISRNVVALGFTSLFTDVSTEMLIPILPLFVTATLGASATGLGLIEGVAESVASLLRTASGWLSDRIGRRKPFLVFGYGISGLAKAAIGLANTWPAVLALRATDRLGKGLRSPPRDALIAESVAPAALGRAFGLHRGMDTLGAAIGPLVSWWLLSRWGALGIEGYRRVFFASAIPAALSVLVLLVFVRAPRHRPAGTGKPSVPIRVLGGAFGRFVAVDAVFQLGNSSNAFVLLRTQAAGWNAGQVALIYVAYNLVLAALSWPFGHLSDRIGRRPLLITGYVLYAAIYALLAWHATRAGVVLAFVLLGVQTAMIDGQARALIARLVPGAVRATAYGAYATVTGLALLPASLAAGWLWDHVGPSATFVAGAALALVAALLLPLMLPAHAEVGA
jgi:MFS family permease